MLNTYRRYTSKVLHIENLYFRHQLTQSLVPPIGGCFPFILCGASMNTSGKALTDECLKAVWPLLYLLYTYSHFNTRNTCVVLK